MTTELGRLEAAKGLPPIIAGQQTPAVKGKVQEFTHRLLNSLSGGRDRGLEVLFTHTQMHDVSNVLFRRLTEGKLTYEEEKMLKGIRR